MVDELTLQDSIKTLSELQVFFLILFKNLNHQINLETPKFSQFLHVSHSPF